MAKSQIDSAALAAITLAAVLALTLLTGPFAWMGSIAGVVLLLVLFGFDQEGYRSLLGSLAFAAVGAFCFAVACGAVLELLAAHGEVHLANGQWQTQWLPFTCAFGAAVLWAIDRGRMAGRLSVSQRLASPRAGGNRSFIRDAETSSPAVVSPDRPYHADVSGTAAVPSQVFEPQQTYSQEAVPQQPVYAEQSSAYTAAPSTSTRPQSMLTPTTSEAVRPAPTPILTRPGKETMIYVTLVGEGLNVMRSVRAEHVGRDYYKIIDTMPEGETWQFQPGQVVRCKKQTLSTGKALVAFEEAPRAQ